MVPWLLGQLIADRLIPSELSLLVGPEARLLNAYLCS